MTTSGTTRNGDPGRVPKPRNSLIAEETIQPTIGLITALPEEFVAMRALMDDPIEHPVAGDVAHYVLGTVPSRNKETCHQIVLTMLSATANNAAANGCANLMRSFPSISSVIMTGIAAGVPNPQRPERHVRLGDIVVGTHGLIDYDHVQAVDGMTQSRKPFPQPSALLVDCANLLQADELIGQCAWEAWLESSQRPDLAGYGRPPDTTDKLHDSAGWPLRHPQRNTSGHRRGFPKVHYGLIGSADRSIRDAAARDHLAATYGVLALEMEGAGIGNTAFLNGRDWFVVRGISDYGDKYRTKPWRRYASLAAAAYVRALLSKCPPLRPKPD